MLVVNGTMSYGNHFVQIDIWGCQCLKMHGKLSAVGGHGSGSSKLSSVGGHDAGGNRWEGVAPMSAERAYMAVICLSS